MIISIRFKTLMPLIVLSSVVVGITVLAVNVTEMIDDANRNLSERFEQIDGVKNLELQVNRLLLPLWYTLEDPTAINHEAINQEFTRIYQQLTNLRSVGLVQLEDATLFKDLTDTLGSIQALLSDYLRMPRISTSANRKHVQDLLLQQLQPLNQRFSAYHLSEMRQVKEMRVSARQRIHSFKSGALSAALVCVLLLVCYMWVFQYILIQPLLALRESTKALAAGDFEHKTPVNSNDELGDVAQDINIMARSLKDLYQRLTLMATHDPLTGLMNRRAFEEQLKQLLNQNRRYRQVFVVALVDIDHFKVVNDTYGHPIGDAVLIHIANILSQSLRECDSCYRYGGEEFTILLPMTDIAAALPALERCRQMVATTDFVAGDIRFRKTISIGIAVCPEAGQTFRQLVTQADQALYAAKNQGRNCTTVFQEIKKIA